MKKVFIVGLLCFVSLIINAEDIVYLTTSEFKNRVFDYTTQSTWEYKGELPCVIDFYATWCGPCRMLSPLLEELAGEYCDQIVVYKVDIDKERELAAVWGITSVPTMLFCPIGERPQMAKGLLPKQTLTTAIEHVLLKE